MEKGFPENDWLVALTSETDKLQYKRRHLLYILELQSKQIQKLKDQISSTTPISEAFKEFWDGQDYIDDEDLSKWATT
tara:strand:- start:94 stop:327 length:234 start_codon:yes stop_codon:yes gene_type:complete